MDKNNLWHRMKKLTLKQHCTITVTLFWAGVGIVVLGSSLSEPLVDIHPLLWIGVAVFLSSYAYRLVFIHCPHCGDKWLTTTPPPEHCPKCGKKVE